MLDDRNVGGLVCDTYYTALARASDIRGLIAGTQNMLAAWRCEPRSIYFPYVTARWAPAIIISILLIPYSFTNHPLKPMEYRSLLERTIDKAQQIADMTFFYFSLLLGITTALNCEQDTGYPVMKLILFLEAILFICVFNSRSCSPFPAPQQPPAFDDENDEVPQPHIASTELTLSVGEETSLLPPPRSNQKPAENPSINSAISSASMPSQFSLLAAINKFRTRQREVKLSPAIAYLSAGLLRQRKISTSEQISIDTDEKQHQAVTDFHV